MDRKASKADALMERAHLRKDALEAEAGLPRRPSGDVPGPSPDPASNLIMADILIRAGSYIVRSAVEKSMLKGRYGPDTAKQILQNRSAAQTLASFAAAKVASRSVPGAVVVGSGILLKALFDQSQKRRARLRGRKKLAQQAQDRA